ncbi:LysR family transcriptional regulator [Streptomyces sp. NPDC050161]|uniref:LysR family transcriptional regulator n=1 Tax=Streptomyces sp. NPDC050161 TaxID=3365604 RepID=UPI0037B9DDEF
MNVAELRWFLVLADTEHVTDAAAMLHIAQPTLSRALHRLEKELGTPLFDRDHHRLRLNPRGEVFRHHVRRALQEIATAEDRIAALLDPHQGTISLAFPHSFGRWLIPELISAYREQAPTAQFLLHSDAADAVVQSLRDGQSDLIITSPEPADPDLSWHPLREERLWLAVPAAHPLAARKELAVSDAASEQFIALRTEFGLRQTTDLLFSRAGITPTIALEATEIATIRGLVASGLGVAVLPRDPDTTEPAGLALIPLTDPAAHRTIGIAWHRTRRTTPAARNFRIFTKERAEPGRSG